MNTKDYNLILEIKKNNYLALEEFLREHKKTIERSMRQLRVEKDYVLDKIFDLVLLSNSNLEKINNIDSYIFSCIKKLKYSLNQNEKKEREKIYKISCNYNIINIEKNTTLHFDDLLNLIDKNTAELVKLRYLDDLTIRQIAKIKNMSKSSVDYNLKKAYKKLLYELSDNRF